MLPTRENVQKILTHFNVPEGVIYLPGQILHERDDTDVELPFRQESNFFYVTGVSEPGFHVVIDMATKRVQLFAPPLVPDDVVWMGMPDSLEAMATKYDVDEVLYKDALPGRLATASAVYTLPSAKTDAVELQSITIQKSKPLHAAFAEARAVKAAWEVDLIRQANQISSDAHVKVMKSTAPGMNESELHALFLYETHRRGAPFQAYLPIFGSGVNAATLHYGKNNTLMNDPTDLLLVDAGAEYKCYASDITRTFPVGGKFTKEAATIYSIVLEMQKACFRQCKAGVPWEAVHEAAMKVACKGLVEAGILVGDEQELLDNDIVAGFFPHGIGHMLGLDVHDLGGYPEGTARIDRPSYRYLRMRRNLAEGFVVTVEPGIYFCDFIIDPLLQSPETSKYINVQVLNQYKRVGGVRIEDNILITKDGYENLTTAPKEIAEIEALMASS